MEEWLLLPQIEQFTLSIYPRSNKGISNRQKPDFIDNLIKPSKSEESRFFSKPFVLTTTRFKRIEVD